MNDGGTFVIMVLINCIFGGVCAAIAQSKGRSAVGWFFASFFLGCICLVLLLCLPNERERLERERVQDDTNRRLREQLRQEQIKVEALRAHTAARLDAHDEALGVNTRAAAPALMGAAPPVANLHGGSQALPPQHAPVDDGTEWYYVDGASSQQGPMSIIALRSAINQGRVSADTLVWHEGLAEWTRAASTAKLVPFFSLS